MKRIGHLFEEVISFDNLLMSARAAMQGCGRTDATCRFFFHLEREILRLQEELMTGSYGPGGYRFFTIRDPKIRTIAVAPFRDRVVHHAVVRILTPIYERVFIHDSYATRPNKGTHAAILRAQSFLRGCSWYLKTDIEKYFDSVDHEILIALLHRKLKDPRLLDLLERIIRNGPPSGKGFPIGNLTSQFLANVYLDPLDHGIKDKMGVRRYIRYMDDMVFFADDPRLLKELLTRVEDFLQNRLALFLKPKATWLNRSAHGLSFLGMRIFPWFIRVRPENRKRSLRRMKNKVLACRRGEIDEDRMIQSLMSSIGHLRYFCPNMGIDLGTEAE